MPSPDLLQATVPLLLSGVALLFGLLGAGFSTFVMLQSTPAKLLRRAEDLEEAANKVLRRCDELDGAWRTLVEELEITVDSLERKRKQHAGAAARADQALARLHQSEAVVEQPQPNGVDTNDVNYWFRRAREHGQI